MAKTGNSKNIFIRFVGNKDTVTFFGILACIAILIVGYYLRVETGVSKVTVPFVKDPDGIDAATVILLNQLGTIKVSKSYAQTATGLIQNSDEVVGKYASYKSNIPAGSLLYKSMIIEKDELPNAAFLDIGDEDLIFTLAVDMESTYANAIRKDDTIDLYLSTHNDDGKLVFCQFITGITVRAVKDSNGNNILKNGSANGSPAELLFSVSENDFILLSYADILGIEIIPIVHGESYSSKEQNITYPRKQFVESLIEPKISVTTGSGMPSN